MNTTRKSGRYFKDGKKLVPRDEFLKRSAEKPKDSSKPDEK